MTPNPLATIKGAVKTPTFVSPSSLIGKKVVKGAALDFSQPLITKTITKQGFSYTQVTAFKPICRDLPPGPKTQDKQNPLAKINNTSANIKFNLPPHIWSLPTDQSLFNLGSTKKINPALRRARMWCYVGADNSNYSTYTGAGFAESNSAATASATLDTNWGFQFLWNPTQIGTSVQRNANLVPQALDGFAARATLFPGTEALSFVAVINRVNDFACFKALNLNTGSLPADLADIALDTTVFNHYSKSAGIAQPLNNLIKDLITKGTMADIEYIFKMINGEGVNGTSWKNALGRKTADINFLAPTPVAVQFGPNADSLSYVGWVESISVSHQMFTEDMIPIHSEVTINMSTYSQSSLSNG